MLVWRDRSRPDAPLVQLDRKALADTEMAGCRPPRMAGVDEAHNTLTQINRIALAHDHLQQEGITAKTSGKEPRQSLGFSPPL